MSWHKNPSTMWWHSTNRDWTWVRVLELQSPRESAIFQLFSASLGKGESSCLSIAASRNLKMLTDDLDARKLAYRREVMVAYVVQKDCAKLLTIHPLKEGQKENRINAGRWRKI